MKEFKNGQAVICPSLSTKLLMVCGIAWMVINLAVFMLIDLHGDK